MKLIWTFLVLVEIAGLSAIVRADNPVIKHRFCADPSPHVFNDTVYLYTTNDQDNSGEYWDSTD